MPDTSIDLSEGIPSIRLKVPTAVVPIPPEGFAQLHSPTPGVLALRLPDGSVVAVGGGGGGGGAATSILGPGGAIDAANSDPRIGININAAPGTGIGFTGRFLDQFAKPLGVQYLETVLDDDAIKNLPTTKAIVVPAPGTGRLLLPLALVIRRSPGFVPYTDPVMLTLRLWWGEETATALQDVSGVISGVLRGYRPAVPAYSLGDSFGSDLSDLPLQLDDGDNSDPYGGGDPSNTLTVGVWYQVVT